VGGAKETLGGGWILVRALESDRFDYSTDLGCVPVDSSLVDMDLMPTLVLLAPMPAIRLDVGVSGSSRQGCLIVQIRVHRSTLVIRIAVSERITGIKHAGALNAKSAWVINAISLYSQSHQEITGMTSIVMELLADMSL